jgi:integrase
MNGARRKRGGGAVYKPPTSRFWHLAYYLDGERHREATKAETEEHARALLEEKLDGIRRGETVPGEESLVLGGPPVAGEATTPGTLYALLEAHYLVKRNRSLPTMKCSFKNLTAFFGERARAVRLAKKVDQYVEHRRAAGWADATIGLELSFLDQACGIAVAKKLLSAHARPVIEKPPPDETRVRQGFFTRQEVETLAAHLPPAVGDVVLFLFFSAWRVGEVRRLEWGHYFAAEGAIRLPASLSKNKRPRLLPIAGDLATILERRLATRRLDCPRIFHRDGQPIGDFRKLWKKACRAIGLSGRIVHDLRRSGVKHLIDAGIDPHTVMAFSGHRTASCSSATTSSTWTTSAVPRSARAVTLADRPA